MLLIGGPNSFDQARHNWGPLREALPAEGPRVGSRVGFSAVPADRPRVTSWSDGTHCLAGEEVRGVRLGQRQRRLMPPPCCDR